MKALEVFKFKETPVTFVEWNGRPAVIAQDLGRALGYSEEGGELVRTIRKHWTDELSPGDDVVVLAGPELERFKAELGVGAGKAPTSQHGGIDISSVLSRLSENIRFAPSLTILFEGGIYIVALKTEKPCGKDLRRWLKSEVLPAINKTGSYQKPDTDLPPRARRSHLSEAEQEANRLSKTAQLLERSGDRKSAQALYRKAASLLAPAEMAELAEADAKRSTGVLTPERIAWLSRVAEAATMATGEGAKRPSEWVEFIEELGLHGSKRDGGLPKTTERGKATLLGQILSAAADLPPGVAAFRVVVSRDHAGRRQYHFEPATIFASSLEN